MLLRIQNWFNEIINISVSGNPCGLEPCKNGAKCINNDKFYQCECRSGFQGKIFLKVCICCGSLSDVCLNLWLTD